MQPGDYISYVAQGVCFGRLHKIKPLSKRIVLTDGRQVRWDRVVAVNGIPVNYRDTQKVVIGVNLTRDNDSRELEAKTWKQGVLM